MTVVAPREMERFLARPPAQTVVFLVFGPDAGLVSERLRALGKGLRERDSEPLEIENFEGNDIADEPLGLIESAHMVSMFGGKRLLHINLGSKSIIPALERLLNDPPQDARILIEAGDLKRDQPLRKLIEGHGHGAALICYPDSEQDIAALVDATFDEAGRSLDAGAREMLMAHLGADRMATRAELEKLLIYTHGQERVQRSDVEDIVADTSLLAVEGLVEAAFSGDLAEVDARLQRLRSGGNTGAVLPLLLRQALALHRARLELDAGKPLDVALQSLMRQGFGGSMRQALSAQLKAQSAARLQQIIDAVHQAVATTRSLPQLAEPVLDRLLWTIARKGGRA
ncbi:MAG: DNA polymerase III subunit delta [Hyphomicrobiales bacterium]|nr:DNA polymerase III subunit delta [Hyphomicrobiales bacterium]